MEQSKKDATESLCLENLNAQRIDRLGDSVANVRDTIRDSIAQLATSIATQAQALAGFRELYAREMTFIHQSLNDMKEMLNELKVITVHDKDKITAVEKDIAVARGSIKGAVMTWSGFVALAAFVIDKIVEILAKK